MFAVFNVSVFTSAFLLFLIQPMVANILLPKVGGSPNIWNTCSVFFQISLLAGYVYSYLVSRKLSLKNQIILHCLLLFCALWSVNFHFNAEQIAMTSPVSDTLIALLKNIFFPFVLLSTTSPLIQRWLSLSELKERKTPYTLYVCSNIGSLLALYAYPLILERTLTIDGQGRLWRFLFAAFFLTVVSIGFYLRGNLSSETVDAKPDEVSGTNPVLIFYWVLFAFIPSGLMLGVTNYLSTDIGGLPFLWILPLSLYLLSFIWTFSKFYTEEIALQFKRLYKISAPVVVLLFFEMSVGSDFKQNMFLIAVHCAFYFVFSVCCHGFLSAKKPSSEKLTLFYLCLAVGGALGGVFSTFIAPRIFLAVWEYPFLIVLSLPFVIGGFPEQRKEFFKIIGKASFLSFIIIISFNFKIKYIEYLSSVLLILSGIVFLFFSFSKKRDFSLLCLLSFMFLQIYSLQNPSFVFKKRNFFGTLSVEKSDFLLPPTGADAFPAVLSVLRLFHGDTLHGWQKAFLLKGGIVYDYSPDTYYGKGAAVEDFFSVFKRSGTPEIGWLGLGAGAIICYLPSETGHSVFEIDRDIVEVSTKHRYFRYLEKCAPNAAIHIGDARIELSKEENQKYDLIVVDVFSSHFIPVHLTTKEAIETYRSKLKPDGTILFHISSAAFDVEPVLAKIAQSLKMAFIVRLLPQDTNCPSCHFPQWGVLANSYENAEIKALMAMPGWRKAEMKEDTMLWTDDFHNLLSAFRR